jgi:hypothetical protein
MSNQRYPLDWPQGYKRTTQRLARPLFKNTTFFSALSMVKDEVKRLCGIPSSYRADLVVSTNIPIRADGEPYSDYARRNIQDPGVAVYFKYNGEDVVLCCDKFVRIEDNLKAIAITIEDMRRIERNGVSDFIKRSFTGFKALPAPAHDWFAVLEWEYKPEPTPHNWQITKRTFYRLANHFHPDKGGSEGAMSLINEAWKQAEKHFKNVL